MGSSQGRMIIRPRNLLRHTPIMATEATPVTASDHARAAWDMLAESDRQFAARRHLQASATLWKATAHAVMAVAAHRGWPCDGSRRDLRLAVERLGEETGNELIPSKYIYAETFRENAETDFMEYRSLAYDGARARDFIRSLLTMAC